MRVGPAGDRTLLHRLQQCRLCLRCRAVDFVRQHQVSEDRPVLEPQGFGAAVVCLDDHAPDDVRRHQIRCELNARVLQMKDARQRPQKRGLPESRNALEKHVPARKQTD